MMMQEKMFPREQTASVPLHHKPSDHHPELITDEPLTSWSRTTNESTMAQDHPQANRQTTLSHDAKDKQTEHQILA